MTIEKSAVSFNRARAVRENTIHKVGQRWK